MIRGNDPRVNDLARPVEYLFAGDFKDLLRNEGRVRVWHLDDRCFSVGVVAILMPKDGAGIDRVAQDIGDAGIGPLPAGAPVASVCVEDFGDLFEAFAIKGHGGAFTYLGQDQIKMESKAADMCVEAATAQCSNTGTAQKR